MGFLARATVRLSALLIFCASTTLAQRHWYVAPSGADFGNECQDPDAPCASIAYALSRAATNAAIPGDSLHLAAGVYAESGLHLDRDMSWIGAGPDATIIEAANDASLATNRVLQIAFTVHARLEGLTIRNGHALDGGDSAEETGGAGGNGGGVLNNGTLALIDVIVVSNRAGSGGAGLSGGRGGDGGGIFNDGSLYASNLVVAFNRSGDGGSGAQAGGRGGHGWGLHNSGVAELHHSTLHDNRGGAGGSGGDDGGAAGRGGIWNSGRLVLFSSTVDGQIGGAAGAGTNGAPGAPSAGGGLWAESMSTSILAHVTFSSNWAVSASAIFSDNAKIDLDHALIGGEVVGELHLAGPALIQDADDGLFTGDTSLLISGADPLFGERGLFGGATPVRRIKPLSPAINAGDPHISAPPATDQRGAPRIQGGRIDIGAYELQPATSYVGAGGVDGDNECRDELEPCATIKHAIAQALPGDEIVVLPGVVNDSGAVWGKPITLRGLGMGTSIWQAVSNRHLIVDIGVTGVVRDLTLRGGRAPQGTGADEGGPGGAIFNEGTLFIERVVFEDNAAGTGGPAGGVGGRGGAIYNNGLLFLHEVYFWSNRAGQAGTDADGGAGGAIYNDGTVHLRDSLFVANEAGEGASTGAGGSGGAIYNAGLLTIDRSAFLGNRSGSGASGGSGGAIFNEDTIGATNITVSGNQSVSGGAGGGISNPGFMTIEHATIAYNTATDAGGFDASGPHSVWRHVLIAENLAVTSGPDARGTVDSLGWNLVGNGADVVLTNITESNLLNVGAGLEPLADNGGATPTHALSPSSAARDAGDPSFAPPPATDQRGYPRLIPPRIDIGALEAPPLDSDSDGLPDYWELQNGLDPFDPGTTNIYSGALGDPDGDYANNLDEYIAGTSPFDSTSVFQVSGIEADESVVIFYSSVTGRLYSLQRAPFGAELLWSNVSGQVDLPGTGATAAATNGAAGHTSAYRITVRHPLLGH